LSAPLQAPSRPSPLLSVRNIEVVYDTSSWSARAEHGCTAGRDRCPLAPTAPASSTTLKAISTAQDEDGEVTRGEMSLAASASTASIPTRSFAAASSGDGGPPHHRRHDVAGNLRLGAFTRSDNDVGADIDMVYKLLPATEGAHLPRRLISPAANSRCRAIGRALMARPKMILMDERRWAVATPGQEVFGIISKINRISGHDPAVEQNARAALSVAAMANHGARQVVLDGSAEELRDNEDVKEFYLGGAGDQRKSFKNLKRFKRRKRWL